MPAPTTLKSSMATGHADAREHVERRNHLVGMREAHALGEFHADEARRQTRLLQAAFHETDEMRLDDRRIGKIHRERRRILFPDASGLRCSQPMSSPITRRSIIDARP